MTIAENIEIRNVTVADLPAIAAMERVCFTDPWSEQSLRAVLQDPAHWFFIAAHSGQEICGYGLASTVSDEGEIANLAVSPAARRQGIGAALLCMLIQMLMAGGAQRAYLEVRVSNEAARKLYAKTGFQNIGLRKNYYTAPREDAIVMCKELPAQPAGRMRKEGKI